jgi:ABC-type branched-subunit amino acid transport system ATPase component
MKAIEFKHVGKQYRLGTVSTGTFSHDLNRWWTMKVRGKEDPFLRIGDSGNQEGEDFVWALRDIDFSVEQGDVVGIIGKNGAGKSTLLKLLSRVTAPTIGEIAVRTLCQKGIVLRDGRTDYMGGIDDAVQHYLQSATGAVEEQKLMVDGINKVKSFLKIADIQINGTPYNHTVLSHDQRVLDVLIKGTTSEEMRCAVQLVFRSLDGMALASFAEGRYKSHLVDIQPGDFEIARHIALPQYLADGDFTVDLYIHEPEVQDFLEAKSIQTLHIEGRHDPYAQNLRLDADGFVGFEFI